MNIKKDPLELQIEYQLSQIAQINKAEINNYDFAHLIKILYELAEKKEHKFKDIFFQTLYAISDYLINQSRIGETIFFCNSCKDLIYEDNERLAWLSVIAYKAFWAQGDWQKAGKEIEKSVTISPDRGSHNFAWILFYFGSFQINRGRYKIALTALAESKQLFKKWHDPKGEISAQIQEGTYYLDRYLYEEAFAHYSEAAEMEKKEFGDISTQTIMMLSQANYRLRKLDDAFQQINLAINVNPTSYTLNDKATMYYFLSWIYNAQGKLDEAFSSASESLRLYEVTQNKRGIIDVLESIGEIEYLRKNFTESKKYYYSCAKARARMGNITGFAAINRRISKLYHMQENHFLEVVFLLISAAAYLITGNLNKKRFHRFFIEPIKHKLNQFRANHI